MNQREIGVFISECRKRNHMTQMELAEKLGVTDRSVSNWENGVCLPDASLYRLLCELLHISINELFAGEYVNDDNYKNVADENLLIMLEHRLYDSSSKEVSFEEFHSYLKIISEVTLMLKRFDNKHDAVQYLAKETGLADDECASAYEFYMKMFNYQ